MLEREVVNRGVPSGVTCLWAGCEAACDAKSGSRGSREHGVDIEPAFLINIMRQFFKFHKFLILEFNEGIQLRMIFTEKIDTKLITYLPRYIKK